MATTNSSDASPHELRSFTVKHPKIPEPRICTLGVQLGPLDRNQAQFLLITAAEPEDKYETPMWSRLSTILTSHQLQTPNASGDYTFYMKTYSENETFLQQMTEQGILGKVVGTPEVKQGFVSFPLVETKISLKEMSKQCAYCERWEMKMLSLKQLLLALIVLLPLDIKAVTVSTALAIPTTNSQARGLTMTIMSMASADNSAANEDRTTSTTAPKQKEGRAPHSFLQSIRDDVVMLESLSKGITPTSASASDTTTPQVNSPSTASSSPSSGINTASLVKAAKGSGFHGENTEKR
ncbi:hypothetical protein FRB96_004051 [Tulasnella sp. 330]|nr:hypothetical protein FRB96_004051 [Tulasnella sp. 330]